MVDIHELSAAEIEYVFETLGLTATDIRERMVALQRLAEEPPRSSVGGTSAGGTAVIQEQGEDANA